MFPRDFNPFEQEPKASQQEIINLTEMYKDGMGPSSPSKLNLFEDEDEDFFRGFDEATEWILVTEYGGKCEMIDPSRNVWGDLFSAKKVSRNGAL